MLILFVAAATMVPMASAGLSLDPPMLPPTPPTNVQVSQGADTVTVTWDAPLFDGGASSVTYRVYKDSAMVADGLSSTSYVDSLPPGMAAATSAHYYVSAVNDAGESAKTGTCIILSPPMVDPGTCTTEAWNFIWWVIGQA